MSKNQEVSAFGDDGAGDEMDIWVVTCPYQTVRIKRGSQRTKVHVAIVGMVQLKFFSVEA